MKNRQRNPRHTQLCLLIAAVFLGIGCMSLHFSGFALPRLLTTTHATTFSSILPDPEAQTFSEDLETDISMIVGFYAQDGGGDGRSPRAKYALVPTGAAFITVQIPPRYYDAADAVYQKTLDYYSGKAPRPQVSFTVYGSVTPMEDEALTMLYEWFHLNLELMQTVGIVGEVTDFAHHLSPYILKVDYIGGVPQGQAVCFSILLILSAIVCLLFLLQILFQSKHINHMLSRIAMLITPSQNLHEVHPTPAPAASEDICNAPAETTTTDLQAAQMDAANADSPSNER